MFRLFLKAIFRSQEMNLRKLHNVGGKLGIGGEIRIGGKLEVGGKGRT
jgi:hypothetical protein